MRRFARLAVVLVVGCLAAAAGTVSPAWAHNELISTTPEDDAKIATAPEAVMLTFNDAVGKKFGFISVTGPDGKQWGNGALEVVGSSVTQPLRDLGPAGEYTVAWRVVSADGHPISGTLSFTLTKAGSGTSTPPPTSAPTETGAASPTSAAALPPSTGGDTSWPMMAGGLVLGAIVLVGLLVGGSVLLRRRRVTGDS